MRHLLRATVVENGIRILRGAFVVGDISHMDLSDIRFERCVFNEVTMIQTSLRWVVESAFTNCSIGSSRLEQVRECRITMCRIAMCRIQLCGRNSISATVWSCGELVNRYESVGSEETSLVLHDSVFLRLSVQIALSTGVWRIENSTFISCNLAQVKFSYVHARKASFNDCNVCTSDDRLLRAGGCAFIRCYMRASNDIIGVETSFIRHSVIASSLVRCIEQRLQPGNWYRVGIVSRLTGAMNTIMLFRQNSGELLLVIANTNNDHLADTPPVSISESSKIICEMLADVCVGNIFVANISMSNDRLRTPTETAEDRIVRELFESAFANHICI
jgi:uncharacterized protein YjbI with pentapeptide repeats